MQPDEIRNLGAEIGDMIIAAEKAGYDKAVAELGEQDETGQLVIPAPEVRLGDTIVNMDLEPVKEVLSKINFDVTPLGEVIKNIFEGITDKLGKEIDLSPISKAIVEASPADNVKLLAEEISAQSEAIQKANQSSTEKIVGAISGLNEALDDFVNMTAKTNELFMESNRMMIERMEKLELAMSAETTRQRQVDSATRKFIEDQDGNIIAMRLDLPNLQ